MVSASLGSFYGWLRVKTVWNGCTQDGFFPSFVPACVDGRDYLDTTQNLVFLQSDSPPQCASIQILDNHALESVESFVVNLVGSAATLNPRSAKVDIIDDDGMLGYS